jgi:hypothetical protein
MGYAGEGRMREAQARGAAGAALRSEIAGLHDALARAEGEAQARSATGAALQSKIAGLCETLARAERETQERAVTGAALQAKSWRCRTPLPVLVGSARPQSLHSISAARRYRNTTSSVDGARPSCVFFGAGASC